MSIMTYNCSYNFNLANKHLPGDDMEKSLFSYLVGKLKSPAILAPKVKEYVFGQDAAVDELCLSYYMKMLVTFDKNRDIIGSIKSSKYRKEWTDSPVSNILLVGKTGTGKTYLVNTIAKLLDIPVYAADMARVTSAGYHGASVSDIFSAYCKEVVSFATKQFGEDAKANKTLLQIISSTGILFLDELDKKRSYADGHRDVAGLSVQQELLKYLDGTKSKEDLPYDWNQGMPLIVAGGAFVGLESIVSKRTSKSTIGFSSVNDNDVVTDKRLTTRDLENFGLMPELLGRLHTRVQLNNLTEEDIVNILNKSKTSSLSDYINIFSLIKKNIVISDDVINLIAKTTIKQESGARGLQSILDSVFRKYLLKFTASEPTPVSGTVNITLEDVVDEL